VLVDSLGFAVALVRFPFWPLARSAFPDSPLIWYASPFSARGQSHLFSLFANYFSASCRLRFPDILAGDVDRLKFGGLQFLKGCSNGMDEGMQWME